MIKAINLACIAFSGAWIVLAAYADGDLHARQYMAHHHYIAPLPTEAQIQARENNEKILAIFNPQ